MHTLNLPGFDAKISASNGKNYIFDPLRKKKVRLTPEEWVRQHFLHFLIHHLGYPAPLIKIEASQNLQHSSYKKRVDMLVSDNKKGLPLMLIECKAANNPLRPLAFTQIAQYNTIFHAPFLTLTNGIQHICYHINLMEKNYTILPQIPPFEALKP